MVAAAYYNPDFNVIDRIVLLSNNSQKRVRRVLISIVIVDNVIGSRVVRSTLPLKRTARVAVRLQQSRPCLNDLSRCLLMRWLCANAKHYVFHTLSQYRTNGIEIDPGTESETASESSLLERRRPYASFSRSTFVARRIPKKRQYFRRINNKKNHKHRHQ